MKTFYSRQREVQALLDIYQESKEQARFTYITGQRRIGKTTLIKYVFLSPKPVASGMVFYFFVGRKTSEAILLEFRKILQEKLDYVPDFISLEGFFEFLFILAESQHLTIIFDEFQNFDYVDESVFSTLQKLWDQYKDKSFLNLITIGSIYSSMEKIFANKHEPLFGRPTDKLKLKAFSLSILQEILTDHHVESFDQLLNHYTLFNGIPKYWDILSYRQLFSSQPEKVFADLFLSPRSLLVNEGRELLMEEFGPKYQTYFSIIEAVAILSKVSVGRIAARVGVESHHLSTYLSSLNEKFDLITKQVSILNPSQKKGRYVLKNRFLQTWFRYIFANQSLVESGNAEVVLNKFKQDFNSYKGLAFEDLVLEAVKSNYEEFPHEEWGGYWDKTREIDIVGINKSQKTFMIGECKLSAAGVTPQVIQKMTDNAACLSSILKGYGFKKYIFVAGKAQLASQKLAQLQTEHNIELVGASQLLS